jgi:CheY-like chemotaxis protein
VLSEVVTLELALKRALAPVATAALARECDVICEVLPEVGEYVLGDRRQFMDLVTRITKEGVTAARGGDVHVRVARQHGGFAPSDTVLVSVSIRRKDVVEDVGCIELALPLAERADEVDHSRELATTRVLVVVPNKWAARVHSIAARRFGALVESVLDASLAHEKLRDATDSGAPFDVLFLDDQAPNLAELLRTLPDSSFANARRILATAIADSPLRTAFAAGVDQTLSKPVLPHELCEAIASLQAPDDRATQPAPPALEPDALQDGVVRRASGLRNLRLAEVLASLAVAAPGRRGR